MFSSSHAASATTQDEETVDYVPYDPSIERAPLPASAKAERVARSKKAVEDARQEVLDLLQNVAYDRLIKARDACFERKGMKMYFKNLNKNNV